jgi:hypothetical protein
MRDKLLAGDATRFAQRLTDLGWDALAEAGPLAAILHGSLATGEYVAGRSDVDLLLVVERPLSDAQAGALLEALRAVDQAGPPLDFRVVTSAVAASPTSSPPLELYFGRHPGEPDEIETHSPGEPDLVVEFWAARRNGRSLCGAEPCEVIGPVPDEWIVGYGLSLLDRWRALADDDANAELMVLTACRIWHFAAVGEIASKSAAAAWALIQVPTLAAIPAALRRRAGEAGVAITAAEVADVLAAARRAADVDALLPRTSRQ